MNRRRHRPIAYSLAILAWLAQLLLPVAHAAAMNAAGNPWCGTPSLQLQTQLRELPAELRAAQQDGQAQLEQLAQCLNCCAALDGQSPPPASSGTGLLRAAGLEAPAPAPLLAARASLSAPPPARGPPSYS